LRKNLGFLSLFRCIILLADFFDLIPVEFGRGIPGAAVTLTTYDMAYQYLNNNLI
jgi:hypothetical protein